jgi:hypothetical protein
MWTDTGDSKHIYNALKYLLSLSVTGFALAHKVFPTVPYLETLWYLSFLPRSHTLIHSDLPLLWKVLRQCDRDRLFFLLGCRHGLVGHPSPLPFLALLDLCSALLTGVWGIRTAPLFFFVRSFTSNQEFTTPSVLLLCFALNPLSCLLSPVSSFLSLSLSTGDRLGSLDEVGLGDLHLPSTVLCATAFHSSLGLHRVDEKIHGRHLQSGMGMD